MSLARKSVVFMPMSLTAVENSYCYNFTFGSFYPLAKNLAAHRSFPSFHLQNLSSQFDGFIIRSRFEVTDIDGTGCISIFRHRIKGSIFRFIGIGHGCSHRMAVYQGSQYPAVQQLFPTVVLFLAIPDTNRLISIPKTFNLKAFRVFGPTAKTNIARHIVLKIDFFHGAKIEKNKRPGNPRASELETVIKIIGKAISLFFVIGADFDLSRDRQRYVICQAFFQVSNDFDRSTFVREKVIDRNSAGR